ncbi:uncharacterized protein Dwil_GK27430 [Drosophila willistoni]|uniref:Uncharacterized protein n=1 Tax=Drosophila willistoni TaxID=7260 RepID=A0A0Q9WVX9_DROWI|nr:uncharacterized protein Dwil_GK27430 [Drosophila willistoni]
MATDEDRMHVWLFKVMTTSAMETEIEMMDPRVKKITLIISQAAPGKSIRQVLADDLIVSHNVDGRNGKYSLKAYPNFLSVLLGKQYKFERVFFIAR